MRKPIRPLKRFPPSVPRKLYWSDDVGGCQSCPDCHAALEPEHHAYMVATCLGGKSSFFAAGFDAGHFCANCPVVVFDRGSFEALVATAPSAQEGEYAVMGVVDLDAVPPDKRHLPFDDTNPIPIVKFTNLESRQAADEPAPPRPDRRKRKKRKKRR